MPSSSAQYCLLVAPRQPDLGDCDFYHSQTLPTGKVKGPRDLRPSPETYLGKVCFAGRSVLEAGPASGFLSFYMEQAGATATCLEPSMSPLWDTVPFDGSDGDAWRRDFAEKFRRIRNSFWFCHSLHSSKVRMFDANCYDIPPELGDHDIGILACVLLHTRSPFSMLEGLARRVKKTRVIVEPHNAALGEEAICRFMPHLGVRQVDTWWQSSPQFFASSLGLQGFQEVQVLFHSQKCEQLSDPVPMFTIVASRQASDAS